MTREIWEAGLAGARKGQRAVRMDAYRFPNPGCVVASGFRSPLPDPKHNRSLRMPRRIVFALCVAAVLPLHAQQDTTRKPTPKKPDLELVPTRSINLDTDEGTWISLDVSPDGRTIVFDLLGDLYTIPVSGGAATPLTTGMPYDAQPHFSRDAQAIGVSRLWMYHKDGGAGIQLYRDPQPLNGAQPVSMLGASFGKDDRYIWYAQRGGSWEYNAGLPQYQLMTFDRRTGRRESRANTYGSAFRPALSPDGRYLVYGSRYEAQTGLRIRDLTTTEEKWLA